ncbi:ribonuclease D [Kamptonema cortianum]|nr:ribonuclease D [Geitlerinema splendidum]MDK3161362.1 ribonuclease D [Kamptonema cortianum]
MKIITKTSDLKDLCERAAQETFVTLDTEFVRETTYWSQLCLIQLGLSEEAFIIDPLSKELDLRPFFELLQNSHLVKVVHSGRQDVEIFYHMSGQIPTRLFDTQIAAMVCGFGESVGYDVLVQSYAKVSLDKSSRYTHWAQRPLTEKQLDYALGDVTHLRVIYEKLYAKLVKEDRLHWLEEELAILTDPKTYEIDPYNVWKRIKVRSPKPRMLGILREIAAWREFTAQRRNMPRGRILRDETMLELAAAAPKTRDELNRMRGMVGFLSEKNRGEELLALIQKGTNLPLEDCPQIKKEVASPPGSLALLEMLKLLLKIKADKYNVAAKLIATSTDLEAIARTSDPNVPALEGWRREVFGNAALALKEGKVAIGIQNNRISLISLE